MNNKTSIKDINEREIIRLILNGDKNYFKLIQKKYYSLIYNLIRKIIKDEDDIDDLVQETFIKVYNALPNYQFNFNFSSWIFKIASNNCIDFIRRKKLNFVYIDKTNEDEEDEFKFDIKDPSLTPEEQLQNKERSQILKEAIKKLPKNYQQVLYLRHEEELDYKEISERLNIPLGTVKIHLFRARKQLLDILKNNDLLIN